MHHSYDHLFCTYDQIHGAAHAWYHLARNNPVGNVAVAVYLQSSKHGSVHMSAADDCERGRAVKILSARQDRNILCAGIDYVFIRQDRRTAHTHDSVFRLQNDVHAFGKTFRYHSRQTDTQIHYITVIELSGHSSGYSFLQIYHVFSPPTTASTNMPDVLT